MAEHGEEVEAEAREAPEAASPAAVALALGRVSRKPGHGPVDDEAVAFLRRQSKLIDLQTEHLHEQRELMTSRLRLGRWKDRVSLTLQGLTVLVGLAVAGSVAVMAWQAHGDHGVTIEAFSVPPDLTQRGLSGKVVASELLDGLATFQAETVTARPASTYVDNWGDDIKVEIPETGVSIGELNRYLRQWLGSQTRVSGEVVRTPTGVAVVARAGDAPGHRFEGAEADLDKLIGQAADAVYAETQPYRHAVYLASHGKQAEAVAEFQRLAATGGAEDRAWAYAGWSSVLNGQGKTREAVRMAEAAIRLEPKLFAAHQVLGLSYAALGREEDAYQTILRQIEVERHGGFIGQEKVDRTAQLLRGLRAGEEGDYQTELRLIGDVGKSSFEAQSDAFDPVPFIAEALAKAHDFSGSRRAAAGNPATIRAQIMQFTGLEDWPSARAAFPSTQFIAGLGDVGTAGAFPFLARIDAHLGRLTEADSLLAQTPLDCQACLAERGEVASFKGDWRAVDRWYGEAVRQAPSLPFTRTDWGAALLRKGDLDGAIDKFAEAHSRGPRFADPLELWGEALLIKRDYAGAIAKFAEADKDAPKWGRNHLKWGEALMLAGRYREARAQYEAANGLELSKADRAALNVLLARTARGALHG